MVYLVILLILIVVGIIVLFAVKKSKVKNNVSSIETDEEETLPKFRFDD
ncbi:hypothetical protein PU629_13245 [Pullulanibacillus sp. KACC 23026]|nr:hypothetical protein [Pullulanibacillus sp. KACC 23026]WEG11135.1 hypothetical protein PU629_13245 [Pullulanibacillus sp. KACC 23026]